MLPFIITWILQAVTIMMLLVAARFNRKTYRALRGELDRMEKIVANQAGAFLQVNVRLERLEGKKFMLRNVQDLPQPRDRGKNGD